MGNDPVFGKGSIGTKTINAVCKTAAEKPMFLESMKKRWCVIPTDGFYEWKKIGPKIKTAVQHWYG